MNEFHFIRPLWLWAFLVVALLLVVIALRKRSQSNWFGVIDPQLMPFVLRGERPQKKRWPLILPAITGILCVFALAGPSWERLPSPSFQNQASLVIALDLSLSMESQDIKPSRLIRAQHKISDILKQRNEGQTALIVYAAEAFTVTPLTQDTETIQLQVQNLSSDLMPAQGSRPDLAITKALALFEQAHIRKGEVLLITDGTNKNNTANAIQQLNDAGHRLLILGVGTPNGAPITKPSGGFVTDSNGAIVIPKLNESELRSLAASAKGRYQRITSDDSDINALLKPIEVIDMSLGETDIKTDTWKDEGYWLILLIIPLVLPFFRKGVLSVILLISILPTPQPSYAFGWDDLWLNHNQRAKKNFIHKQHEAAAEQFSEPNWKAAAQYRAGKYEDAINTLSDIDTADALYNKGNAYAQLGKGAEAIQHYEQALELEPDNEDAKHNLELLKKQQEQQKQDQQSQKDKQENEQDSSSNENKDSEQSDSEQKNSEQSKSDQSQQEKQNSEEQEQEQEQKQPTNQKNEEEQAEKTEEEKNAEQNEKPKEEQQAQASEKSEEENQDAQKEQQQLRTEPLSEEQQAIEQWIRRIPDDPGGLLRRKFKHQHDQKRNKSEKQKW